MKRLQILPQPNDVTCGPTCLQAIYQFYGKNITLEKVIAEIKYLPEGGTLGVYLGLHALAQGFEVTINVINLEVFDPTWFVGQVDLVAKLQEQLKYKKKVKIRLTSEAFIEFLQQGGKVISHDISSRFLKAAFDKNIPLLTGLSATHLYRCAREVTEENDRSVYDDVRGEPSGHFVVLNGYESDSKRILVADPYERNPLTKSSIYKVRVSHLINAIMLGALTYDTNLIFITPNRKK
jgi:hypothetical protein